MITIPARSDIMIALVWILIGVFIWRIYKWVKNKK
jgi:hypothetical protein